MKDVTDFLEKNGFVKSKINNEYVHRINGSFVTIFDDYYEVYIPETDGVMWSNDINIYWLIGVLTYYNLIEKDYKI
jgi:hypothetical protein